MAKFCPNCGTEINGGACPNCAKPQVNNVQNTEKSNGFAIAGFIISIVSPVLCCGSLSTLSLILSIVGLVTVNKNGQKGKGLAVAGIVISAITLIFSMILVFTINVTEVLSSLDY